MPFIQVDPVEEQREFDELLKDPEAKRAHEEFEREYDFNQKLSKRKKVKHKKGE